MKDIYQIDFDAALTAWLEARERFLTRAGRDVLDEYAESNCRLFAAFAEGWAEVEPKAVIEAFALFRKFAMQEADANRPERVRYHLSPVCPAVA